MTINPKQARFVEEYLVDLNASDAARRAGYSKKTSNQKGYELRHMPEIQEAIIVAMQARSKRTEAKQDWILERLVENVERAMQLKPVIDSHGKPTGEHVYKGNVANKALELLGRHEGMFTDNLNLSGGLKTTHEEALKELE